jgi:hypothetical protein
LEELVFAASKVAEVKISKKMPHQPEVLLKIEFCYVEISFN